MSWDEEDQQDDPWSGDEEDFLPPKIVETGTYRFHVSEWEISEDRSHVVLTARIAGEPGNGGEGGRKVTKWFWANSRHELRAFLVAVLGKEKYEAIAGNGRRNLINTAEQAKGCPFIAEVIHGTSNRTGNDFATIDLETVSPCPESKAMVPPDEEDGDVLPF